MRGWRLIVSAGVFSAVAGVAGMVRAGEAKPPRALTELEREVGLRLAHVRDIGPVEHDQREMLREAAQYDAKGEQALKASDYKGAEDDFRRAAELLQRLGT